MSFAPNWAGLADFIAGIYNAGAVTVSGQMVVVAAEFTRPSNSTAYTAGDVVSNNTTMITLANFARTNGGSGYIVRARLTTNLKSITPRFRVHLFNDNTATVSGDNLPWRELYADASKRLGYFVLPAMTTGADTTNSDMSRCIDDGTMRIPFVAGGTRAIYAVLETLDAFTPASGEKFTLALTGDLN